ncbi:hypothetical protein AAFF_G00096780 [Aldrovandia affinis]|uniref:BH3-interacting domain death agonist n=1 Tax=Aldrovandia affinis TaxID=143900 RepID=A0AAD7RVJ3_9TELE|nr:hypothetical protein AAFF_G00096780 [Aldrovandia affinis]
MDSGNVGMDPITPLVFLSFLQQQGCRNEEFVNQLADLGNELKLTKKDINCNGFDGDAEEDGELQTDGHFCCGIRSVVAHLEPSVEVAVHPADAAALRNVAAELIAIADQLESRDWKRHLSMEVERVMGQVGTGLEQLPQERVLLALTMTLVKGVCERVPRLLHNLFTTALEYMGPAMPRGFTSCKTFQTCHLPLPNYQSG